MSWVLAGPQTNCSKYVTNNYVMLIPGQRTNGFDDLNMWFCAGVKETGDTQGEGTKPRMRIGTDPLWFVNGSRWAQILHHLQILHDESADDDSGVQSKAWLKCEA